MALANLRSLFAWVAVETVAELTPPHKRLTLALRCGDAWVAGHCNAPGVLKHGHLLSDELPFFIMIRHGQWLDLLKKRLDLLKIFFLM